jgi:antitoxin HicB
MMLSYPIKLIPDDNDTLLATSPDFPELTTFGDDQDDALMHAMDALEEAIASRIADREDIPRPSRGKLRVTLPTQTAMKVLLYQAMAEQGLKKSDLARRLAWHSPQVDRLFDLRHASRVDQMDAAFAAIGRRLEVGVGEVP